MCSCVWLLYKFTDCFKEKDETDSGYRSGTIPEDKLPRQPSQATLNREDLRRRIEEYNSKVPVADFSLVSWWDNENNKYTYMLVNIVTVYHFLHFKNVQ